MLLDALHELLQQTRSVRENAASAASVAVGQQRPLNQREMMSVLSLLQATPSTTLRAAIGDDSESLAQRLKNEVLSSATRLGVDPASARLDPMDEDAIDLVGMLFDVMLDERDLEGRSRDLIGRLVVPFVKVAMLDRKMFVQKTHPARRLLNSLAEACEGNAGDSPADRVLMAKVEEIIDRLLAEFNENLAIFMTLEEEFREFLGQHRRRIEIAERRAAETQRGQEKLELARTRALAELERRIGIVALPVAVEAFLRRRLSGALPVAMGIDQDKQQPLLFIGEPQRMRFVADVPDYLGRGGPYLHDLSVGGSGTARTLQIVLTMVQSASEVEESAPLPPEPLAPGLEDVAFGYRGIDPETGQLGDWQPQWELHDRLPVLVRVELRDGHARWPPVVVALPQTGTAVTRP
ncbi:DUF1631 family protein [Xanthomonas sp. Kuri4-1]